MKAIIRGILATDPETVKITKREHVVHARFEPANGVAMAVIAHKPAAGALLDMHAGDDVALMGELHANSDGGEPLTLVATNVRIYKGEITIPRHEDDWIDYGMNDIPAELFNVNPGDIDLLSSKISDDDWPNAFGGDFGAAWGIRGSKSLNGGNLKTACNLTRKKFPP